jgi:hypothetical protein
VDFFTLFTLVLLRPLGGVNFVVIFLLLCFTLCPFVTKRGSNFYFWTGIVFLTGQVIFVLVCNWPHYVGKKSLLCKDSAIHKCLQKILHNLQVRNFGSLPAVKTPCHPVRTM